MDSRWNCWSSNRKVTIAPLQGGHSKKVVFYFRKGAAVFTRIGVPVSHFTFPHIWNTQRITIMDIPFYEWCRVIKLLNRWRSANNNVVGLQIDFDAANQCLDNYSDFLRKVRAFLPHKYALGVTGLLDWAKAGDVEVLNSLPVDELVVQSYQGRKTVKRYSSYLPALPGLSIPLERGDCRKWCLG